MEDEARWAIRKRVILGKQVPNYLNWVYPDGVKKIKPESVPIIHSGRQERGNPK
jgi:NitT/TauT family transport system substrate-binding protein